MIYAAVTLRQENPAVLIVLIRFTLLFRNLSLGLIKYYKGQDILQYDWIRYLAWTVSYLQAVKLRTRIVASEQKI